MATFYIDPEEGSNINNGNSFATRRQNVSGTPSVNPGDTFRFVSSPNPTTVVSSGSTWNNKSATVSMTLPALFSTPHTVLNNCETFWNNGGVLLVNVTRDFTNYVQGSSSLLITIPSFSAPGVLAYDTIVPGGSPVNLSAYRKISFSWRVSTVAGVSNNHVRIDLCSDVSGLVPVNSFLLPALTSINTWEALTLDYGSALGSSIRSIAVRMMVPMVGNINFDGFLAQASLTGGPPNVRINACDGLWSSGGAAGTVVSVDSTNYRLGSSSLKISTGLSSGLLAYDKIDPGGFSVDLSGYQQISFWVRTSAQIGLFTIRIDLCVDLSGEFVANYFYLPQISNYNVWIPITINYGAPLHSSIRSISIRRVDFLGPTEINFDNFIAVKSPSNADSLSLTSLVTNDLNSGNWYAIRSIHGSFPGASPILDTQNIIELDQHPRMSAALTPRGYYGISGSNFPLYKRETVKTGFTSSDFNNVIDVPFANVILSGGWDRNSSMSIQNGETWLDGRSCFGVGVNISLAGVTVEKIACVRYRRGWQINGMTVCGIRGANSNSDIGVYVLGVSSNTANTVSVDSASGNGTHGVSCNSPFPILFGNLKRLESNFSYGLNFEAASRLISTGTIEAYNNTSGGANLIVYSSSIQNLITNDNSGSGVIIQTAGPSTINSLTSLNNLGGSSAGLEVRPGTLGSYDIRVNSITTSGNAFGIYSNSGVYGARIYVSKAQLSETNKFLTTADTSKNTIYSNKENSITDNHFVRYSNTALVQSEIGVDRRTASGMAWKLLPALSYRNSTYPVQLSIAKIVVKSGGLVTFKAWMKRTHATNVSGRIVIFGGRIAGVPNDISASITAGAGTYQELTLSFTPTEAGTVEVFAEAYSNVISTPAISVSDSVYIDDLSQAQA